MEKHKLASLDDTNVELATYDFRSLDPITKTPRTEKIKTGEPTHAV